MKSILLIKTFLGLVEMTSGLVNVSFSLPEWQAVKMIFFAPCFRIRFLPLFQCKKSTSKGDFSLAYRHVVTENNRHDDAVNGNSFTKDYTANLKK